MKRVSVKTVDGGRNEFILEGSVTTFINERPEAKFMVFPVDGGIKIFNLQNIVSFTEIEIEE